MSKAENPTFLTMFGRIGVRKLGGGEVNEAFLYGSTVIHLIPLIVVPNEEVATVLNRWSYPDKPKKIHVLQSSLQGLPDLRVPLVYRTGEVMYRGRNIPYWIEDYIEGKTLLKASFEGIELQIYERVINWLSAFHSAYQSKDLLRDYYYQRLSSLDKLIGLDGGIKTLLGEDRSGKLCKLIHEVQNEVNNGVDENERVTTTHGDLRGENLLINNGVVGIIDFEQGVNGGDWFVDIEKLLMMENQDLPNPSRPSKYRPPLSMDMKQKLVDLYITLREKEDSTVQLRTDLFDPASDYYRLRYKLFSLDNSLSTAAMKYYLGLSNQIAGVGQIDTKAILHRIEMLEKEFHI